MAAAVLPFNIPGFNPHAISLAQAMVACRTGSHRVGSDWPHPGARANMPDDGDVANQFGEWVPDESMRKKILVENPAKLYGF